VAGPRRSSLDALADLMEQASRVGGGRRWEDRSFLPALELLVGSCDATAELNPRGRRVLDGAVVRHLVNRLLIEVEVATRPSVASTPVGPAVVVTGLPRTGTTLLHNLLALDPGWRPLRLWEALRPVPPDPSDGFVRADLVRQAATWLARLHVLVPDFRAIHAVTPEGPEECDALLQNDFASQHFDDMFDAEAYSAWLAEAPLRREYASYARQLTVLRAPADGAPPWVLKSPSHLGHLDALLDALPEAVVVHCHRDPEQAVPSYASLVLCLRRAYSDNVRPDAVGRQALQRCATALARAVEVRRGDPGRFIDIRYDDLVHRPLAVVAGLYEQLGRPLRAGVTRAMTDWMARHPQHEHGKHRYEGADFGLTPRSIQQAFGASLDGDPTHPA